MNSFEVTQIDGELATEISKIYTQFRYGWSSNHEKDNYHHWNFLIKEVPVPYLFDIRVMPEWNDLLEDIYNQIGLKWSVQRTYINGYTYGTDAASHKDSPKSLSDVPQKTAIIYLNDEWNLDWGGETALFDEGEIIYSILPAHGRVLLFDSHMLHAARPLSRHFHGLRKILAIKYFDPDYTTPFLNYLYENTKGYEHSGRSFLHHLFSVAEIASKNKFDDDVIRACYFHSIYGTEYYNFKKNISRDEIRKQIGVKAESLVHEFCTMKDRTKTILKSDSLQLKQIEYANLLDQNIDGKFHLILQELDDQIFNTK